MSFMTDHQVPQALKPSTWFQGLGNLMPQIPVLLYCNENLYYIVETFLFLFVNTYLKIMISFKNKTRIFSKENPARNLVSLSRT